MTGVAVEVSADLASQCRALLLDLDPEHGWDVLAGYPHDSGEYGYVIRGARLGDGPQPFVVIQLGDPGALAQYPELLAHVAEMAAQGFVDWARRHDNPGIDELPARAAAWSALHGR